MLPDCRLSVVGIRPGEKLHEVMVTDDDARSTLELPDRYMIEPLFDFWNRKLHSQLGAKTVAEDFRYASDTNTEWLSVVQIRELLKREREKKA